MYHQDYVFILIFHLDLRIYLENFLLDSTRIYLFLLFIQYIVSMQSFILIVMYYYFRGILRLIHSLIHIFEAFLIDWRRL